jgi:hypothetical protein
MVVVAITLITAMGVLYIISAGNQAMISRAKEGLKAVLIGIVVMLSAWLLVSTVLSLLANTAYRQGDPNFLGLERGQGTFGLECSTTSSAGTAHLPTGGTTGATPGAGGTSGAACSQVPAPNNCSIPSLQSTCLGSNQSQLTNFSAICYRESRGVVNVPSTTDYCGNTPVSFGLFQLNISANTLVDSSGSVVNCPSAFTAPFVGNRNACALKSDKTDLYNRCKAIATDRNLNLRNACRLRDQGAASASFHNDPYFAWHGAICN